MGAAVEADTINIVAPEVRVCQTSAQRAAHNRTAYVVNEGAV